MPVTELDLLDQIGVRRGCLRAGGKIDRERTATLFINELRSGAVGKISFETPDLIVKELCHLTTFTT
jgi:ribosome biogenesis GTPase A